MYVNRFLHAVNQDDDDDDDDERRTEEQKRRDKGGETFRTRISDRK